MPGHVFIVRSDVTRLRCDAWLLPTSARFGVTRGFRRDARIAERVAGLYDGRALAPAGWGADGKRTIAIPEAVGLGDPVPFLTNVGRSGAAASWYVDGARQFLHAAANRLGTDRRTSRAKPLFAMPFVGTGRGGAATEKGAVVGELVAMLHEEAARLDVDIALVLFDGAAFVAAQNARRAFLDANPAGAWPDLDSALAAEAERLAEFAVDGHLVLFIGAGVGQAAGLPGWDALLDQLAAESGMGEQERAALRRMHELDRPRIVQHRMAAQGRSMGEAICALVSARSFSLAHAVLASLPSAETVTTNYDELYEDASRAAGRPAAVLPYQSVSGHDRWLLKLHGSVTHPGDIVLTREDYIRYADRRAALGAIVQALLITRHMLFVGFSLRDDNFHRIVDDVRKAVRPSGAAVDPAASRPGPFGSALLLRRDPLLEELWRDDLRLVGVGEGGGIEAASRTLEVFLDRLLADATRGTSPLLDDAYDAVLTREEREIRTLLRKLDASVSDAARESSAWRPIAALMERLGQHPRE